MQVTNIEIVTCLERFAGDCVRRSQSDLVDDGRLIVVTEPLDLVPAVLSELVTNPFDFSMRDAVADR